MWNEHFDEQQDVAVDNEHIFRVYFKGRDKDNVKPLLVLLHGGGYSALTWAHFCVTYLTKSFIFAKIRWVVLNIGRTFCFADWNIGADRLSVLGHWFTRSRWYEGCRWRWIVGRNTFQVNCTFGAHTSFKNSPVEFQLTFWQFCKFQWRWSCFRKTVSNTATANHDCRPFDGRCVVRSHCHHATGADADRYRCHWRGWRYGYGSIGQHAELPAIPTEAL